MTNALPLTPEEFAAALAQTGWRGKMNRAADEDIAGENIIAAAVSGNAIAAAVSENTIAAAVSGGSDSMALALLLHAWAQTHDARVVAFTVDHKLRPEAAEEARRVHEILAARGITHHTLAWEGEKPATHLQERAREARYGLLRAACTQHGIETLAVAHHLEDRIETFWMRLAHGSGPDGLAGMAAARTADGINIIRPLLAFPRARLRATCAQQGVAWIEDPSNRNEKYLRVRLRGFEDMLAGEGLTPQRLARTLDKLADAKDALQFYAQAAFENCVTRGGDGVALDVEKWRHYPRDIQRRVLRMALDAVTPQQYPAGFEKIEAVRRDLLGENFKGRTLAGCTIMRGKGGRALISQETCKRA